ncbi:MAG: XRE family transcriptional regulator [Sphingobium sp.]
MSDKVSRQQRIGALEARGWTAASGERLKAVARNKKWNQGKLATAAGISRSSLLAIFAGTQTPREETLVAICEVLQINDEDIIRSPEERLYGPPDKSRPLSGDVRLGKEDYNLVRRYDVKVSAGMGLIPSSEASSPGMAFPRSWLLQRGIAADLSGLVRVKGDSMAPAIPDGATVLVQFTPVVANEGVYVFRREGEVFVKRLHPLEVAPDGRARSIAVISDNPEYRPEIVVGSELNEVKIIGRVRHVMFDV